MTIIAPGLINTDKMKIVDFDRSIEAFQKSKEDKTVSSRLISIFLLYDPIFTTKD